MKKIQKEDFIYLFILLCPILDIFSSIINFGSFSPSLFIRPIIPLILLIYIFFKDKKNRKYMIIAGFVYILFSSIHLLLYKDLMTGISYGGIIYEASYLCNYTFLIFNLFLFIYIYKDNSNNNKLIKIFVAYITIYIISIYLSIITNTSGTTYIEGIGYKGWFNTGGAVGSIFISSLFILMPYLFKNRKYFWLKLLLIASIMFYLCFLLGTRVGLLGALIVLFCDILFQIFCSIIKTNKIVLKKLLVSCGMFIVIIIGVMMFGSECLERREHLDNLTGKVPVDNSDIIDSNEKIYMAYDLVKLKVQIENNIISEEYMSIEQQQALLRLDEHSNKNKLDSTDLRRQQFLYNHFLYQEQNAISLKLFGNGYLANMGVLTLEMEIVAFFYNFGIIGFIIFLGPFFSIFGYGIYKGIRNIRKVDTTYLMLLAGCFMTYMISFLAGHTYFNSSVMIVIVLLHTLLFKKAFLLTKEK